MAGLQLNCLPAGLLLLPPPPALPDESVSPDALDTSEEQALSTGQAPEEGELDKVYNQDGQIPRQEKLHSKPVVNINGQVSIGKSPYALDASEKQGLTSRTENLTAQGHISELDVVLYIDGKIPRKEMLHTGPAPVHINGQVSNEEKPHTKLDANSTLNNQKFNEKLPVDSKARSLTDHPQPDASLEYHKDLPSQLTTTNLTDGNVMLTYSTASGITAEKHVQYKQRKGNCCTQLIMKLRKAAKDGKQRLRSCGFASLACVIAYICRYSGMSVLYAFLPMKVVSVGLPPDTAAYLMSILSMGELVGRIGVTATAWLHNRLPLIYFVVSAVLAGILEAVMGFTQTLMPMVVIVSILGLNAGVLSCIATTVVRDTVGITNLPWVLGLASGAAGISNLSSIQLLAWIWQETGSISILFLIAGSSLVCAGLSFVVYHGCPRAHKPRYP